MSNPYYHDFTKRIAYMGAARGDKARDVWPCVS